jgi:hypothetical protein
MDVIPIINVSIWLIVKWIVLFAFGLYLAFALVVLRQVQLMTKTLEVGFESFIKALALGHLLFAIGALLLAFIIL